MSYYDKPYLFLLSIMPERAKQSYLFLLIMLHVCALVRGLFSIYKYGKAPLQHEIGGESHLLIGVKALFHATKTLSILSSGRE